MTLENVLLEPTLDSVKGVMIMDNNGVRILANYYDDEIFPNTAAQKKFEKTLFTKTHKVNEFRTIKYILRFDLSIVKAYIIFWPQLIKHGYIERILAGEIAIHAN